jgi:pimeloyl-ACP methyl ester carboxylesterase
MPSARVRGTRIHYDIAGQGEPVLLIHGLGSSGADWAMQLLALTPHYRVVVPDLRGSGRSGKPRGPYHVRDFARDLWSLLKQLEIARAHLVGFSLGGAVALEMALERPQGADRLVMINALPNYHDTWRKWAETRLQTGLVRTWSGGACFPIRTRKRCGNGSSRCSARIRASPTSKPCARWSAGTRSTGSSRCVARP